MRQITIGGIIKEAPGASGGMLLVEANTRLERSFCIPELAGRKVRVTVILEEDDPLLAPNPLLAPAQ